MTFLVLVTGLVTGAFSALLGVGGGTLMVPFMTLVLDYGQHTSEGTALLVVIPTAIVGVFAHTRRGYVDFRGAALLAAGGVVGAVAAAKAALAISEESLKLGFGIFLVAVGLRMFWHGARRERAQADTA
ncbi:MAG TPA: sulfite exporter TauE/SafE family protein [Actinomycetota bacterium]|nr:sulfite exporter TauE/SafE family protein [Actinomycetota bacterium]